MRPSERDDGLGNQKLDLIFSVAFSKADSDEGRILDSSWLKWRREINAGFKKLNQQSAI